MTRRTRATVAMGTAVLLVLATWVGEASAHVTVDSLGVAHQGDELAKLGFGVPNESDTAGTVKVEVQMPKDTPLTFVAAQPKAGWKVSVTTRKLDTPIKGDSGTIDTVVDVVTWTADGTTTIGPGEFDQFWISAGPLPDSVTEVQFPTVQTYSDGNVVRWIEPTPASGKEPEHPVPTLGLVPAEKVGGASSDGVDGLALAALIVAVVALVLGGFSVVAGRRRQLPAQTSADGA